MIHLVKVRFSSHKIGRVYVRQALTVCGLMVQSHQATKQRSVVKCEACLTQPEQDAA